MLETYFKLNSSVDGQVMVSNDYSKPFNPEFLQL